MRRLAAALVLLAPILAAACTSTEATLDPSAINTPPAPLPAPDGTTASALPQGDAAAASNASQASATPPVAGQLAAIGGPARVQIAPLIGAPSQAAAPLSDRLVARAPAKRFAIVPANDPTATHILKGFFSTSPEGGATVVYYVWDVMDRNGNRVHRFSGQEKVSAAGDGWTAVTDATMQAIADRTADEFALWLAGRTG